MRQEITGLLKKEEEEKQEGKEGEDKVKKRMRMAFASPQRFALC